MARKAVQTEMASKPLEVREKINKAFSHSDRTAAKHYRINTAKSIAENAQLLNEVLRLDEDATSTSTESTTPTDDTPTDDTPTDDTAMSSATLATMTASSSTADDMLAILCGVDDEFPHNNELSIILGRRILPFERKKLEGLWRYKQTKIRANVLALSLKRLQTELKEADIRRLMLERKWERKDIIKATIRVWHQPPKTNRKDKDKRQRLIRGLETRSWQNIIDGPSPLGGRGVYVLDHIEKGFPVCQYEGELREAIATDNTAAETTYMFHFIHHGKRMIIDATTDDGTLGRLINPSPRNVRKAPEKPYF